MLFRKLYPSECQKIAPCAFALPRALVCSRRVNVSTSVIHRQVFLLCVSGSRMHDGGGFELDRLLPVRLRGRFKFGHVSSTGRSLVGKVKLIQVKVPYDRWYLYSNC